MLQKRKMHSQINLRLSDLNFNVTHDVDMSIWPEGRVAALKD